MALANFIDRAATAASQVLGGFDLKAFEHILSGHVVGIAFDGEAASSTEGAATLDLVVRLIARLYPEIAVLSLDDGGRPMARSLCDLARSINPDIGIASVGRAVTHFIVVGSTVPRGVKGRMFFAGSRGWTALLSRSNPMGSGSTSNPFGAGAAACFAAANVFRSIFADQLVGGELDEEIAMSLLDYGQDTGGGHFLPTEVDIGEAHLVGLGAIGNGAIWSLARSPWITGSLHIIDHELVELSNLQRYVLALQADVGRRKVDLATKAFGHVGLEVIPHPERWANYASGHRDWRFERVAVALDTAADRIALQGALPRWITNAWTQQTDLGVSRHAFVDGRACLACLYLPAGKVKDEDERLAEEMGLLEARLEIRAMLQTNVPVSAAFVSRVASALGVPEEHLLPFVGQSLRSFHKSAICGGVVFSLTGGRRPVQAVVPMPFQSALAGILLAAELVKHAAGRAVAPMTSTRINLLRPLGRYLHDPAPKDTSGRCICNDPDFVAAYRLKYAATACG